jgi:uncharacterized membrane protein YdcZ (DUF606 family)
MNKKIFANVIAFIVGIYFIVRACFWYKNENGDIRQNKYFAAAYFCAGILAIVIQLAANYRKKKNKNSE